MVHSQAIISHIFLKQKQFGKKTVWKIKIGILKFF